MKLLCMIAVFLCIPWVASDAQKQDWGNLKRYAEANKELVRKGKQKDRVVFMGNSITEGWVANDAAFFEKNGYVGRGISGQTSSHFLLRFRDFDICVACRCFWLEFFGEGCSAKDNAAECQNTGIC